MLHILNPNAPLGIKDKLVLDGAYAGLFSGGNIYINGYGSHNASLVPSSNLMGWRWDAELLNRPYINLNGSNEYIFFGIIREPILTLGDQLTFATWVRIETLPGARFFFSSMTASQYTNWWFAVYNTASGIAGCLNISNPGWAAMTTNYEPPLNVWFHLAYVYNGSTFKVYVNGEEIYSQNASGNIGSGGVYSSGSANTALGSARTGTGGGNFTLFLDGDLADSMFWHRALRYEEVKWIAQPENNIYTIFSNRKKFYIPEAPVTGEDFAWAVASGVGIAKPYKCLYFTAINITDCTTTGSTDGELEITAEGGDTSYTYSIDGITYQASNEFTGLTAEDYTVYVKDDVNKIVTFDVKVKEPQGLIESITIF